jgi:hypothetical protein
MNLKACAAVIGCSLSFSASRGHLNPIERTMTLGILWAAGRPEPINLIGSKRSVAKRLGGVSVRIIVGCRSLIICFAQCREWTCYRGAVFVLKPKSASEPAVLRKLNDNSLWHS